MVLLYSLGVCVCMYVCFIFSWDILTPGSTSAHTGNIRQVDVQSLIIYYVAKAKSNKK